MKRLVAAVVQSLAFSVASGAQAQDRQNAHLCQTGRNETSQFRQVQLHRQRGCVSR
jgi:hypothetical protein